MQSVSSDESAAHALLHSLIPLSFLGLTVIPSLKLTPDDLFDVGAGGFLGT